jgi:alpha-beta hydrolase superfamily lysophospholipase
VHHDTFLRASDDTRLYAWTREPAGEPRGVFALVHGMGEHSRRYDHLGEFWQQRGYASAGFDHRGHGRSDGPRGHTPSYEQLMDDIKALLDAVAQRWPDRPVVLYGHSLGGNLVLNYAIRRQPPLAAVVAVVATSPYLRLAFAPPAWRIAAARLLRRAAPSIVQRTGLSVAALSHDPAVGKRLESDPLVHDRISAGLFTAAHDAGSFALAHAGALRLPTLVMHGSADRITSVEASREFVAAAAGRATLRIWDGWYHELHNEPEWEDAASFVLAWIDQAG